MFSPLFYAAEVLPVQEICLSTLRLRRIINERRLPSAVSDMKKADPTEPALSVYSNNVRDTGYSNDRRRLRLFFRIPRKRRLSLLQQRFRFCK